MSQLLSTIFVFVSSMYKFSIGSLAAIGGGLGAGGPLSNLLGGILSIILFTYTGGFIRDYLVSRYPQRYGKKFTKASRLMVYMKRKLGLRGLAIITPLLLNTPFGIMLALGITNDRRKIAQAMILSCVAWSFIFYVPYFAFDIDVSTWLKTFFHA